MPSTRTELIAYNFICQQEPQKAKYVVAVAQAYVKGEALFGEACIIRAVEFVQPVRRFEEDLTVIAHSLDRWSVE